VRLLFHCCCGPCSLAAVESLCAEGADLTLFWHNPNIHPFTEYRSRLESLRTFAEHKKLPLEVGGEYGLYGFIEQVGPGTEFGTRCKACYRMRLEKTAARAAELGLEAFSTSLLISPHQEQETIRRIGEELAERYGVAFLYRDFRPLFREGQAKARELGLYMQKYCGCIFSEADRYAAKKAVRPR